jgi:hypothetical protein
MVININPNYIPSQRPATGRSQERKREDEGIAYKKPSRVEENFIPEPDSLATIIRNAIASLRQGIVWDRGTILNLVV